MEPKIGLDDVENKRISPVSGLELRPLGHPTRSQSLYRLLFILFPTVLGAGVAKKYRLDGRSSIRGKVEKFFNSPQRQDRL
jgi:hypothetical protein